MFVSSVGYAARDVNNAVKLQRESVLQAVAATL